MQIKLTLNKSVLIIALETITLRVSNPLLCILVLNKYILKISNTLEKLDKYRT